MSATKAKKSRQKRSDVKSLSHKKNAKVAEEIHRFVVGDGLTVMVLPKKSWTRSYALLGTNYGSIDNNFDSALSSKTCRMPAGIAHFLEHKMFEKEDGDVMDKFATLGCSTNAMTSFNYTGYLIDCNHSFAPCLDLLVDFVTRPYFKPDLVEKEKGIIAEEIKMYRDDPSWCGFMGVLENLYGNHPMALDIAGTTASILDIRAEDLDLCYGTFYTPANMQLAVAGRADPNEVADIAAAVLERNQQQAVALKRRVPKQPKKFKRRRTQQEMSLVGPKFYMGWLADPEAMGADAFTRELALELFTNAGMTKGSALYQELYDAGLLNDSFGVSVSVEEEFAFVLCGGDTSQPAELEAALLRGIEKLLQQGLPKGALRRTRRRLFGSFLRSLDSVGTTCWNLIDLELKGHNLLNYGRELMRLDENLILGIARATFAKNAWASHTVVPHGKA